jgi:hypothetical protein
MTAPPRADRAARLGRGWRAPGSSTRSRRLRFATREREPVMTAEPQRRTLVRPDWRHRWLGRASVAALALALLALSAPPSASAARAPAGIKVIGGPPGTSFRTLSCKPARGGFEVRGRSRNGWTIGIGIAPFRGYRRYEIPYGDQGDVIFGVRPPGWRAGVLVESAPAPARTGRPSPQGRARPALVPRWAQPPRPGVRLRLRTRPRPALHLRGGDRSVSLPGSPQVSGAPTAESRASEDPCPSPAEPIPRRSDDALRQQRNDSGGGPERRPSGA